MRVFVIGVTGGVGALLAADLRDRGDAVRGLVRREDQRERLASRGVEAVVADLATVQVEDLAAALGRADAVVFAAGSNASSAEVTRQIDGAGLDKAVHAARLAGARRFLSLSVLPESWRERDLSDDEELYFATKKAADVSVSRSGLDWVVLRPSLLTDAPGTGLVALGPAQLHGEVPRADVAATAAEILHEPRIGQQILELDGGLTPIPEAVRANVRHR